MKPVGRILAGLTALALGFAAGARSNADRKVSPTDPDSTADGGPVTFTGGYRPSPGLPAAKGDFAFATFEQAGSRLAELTESYRRLSPYHHEVRPVEAERLLRQIEAILALAKPPQLVAWIEGLKSGGREEALHDLAFAALTRLSPATAARTGLPRWTGGDESFEGLRAFLAEWEGIDPAAAQRWTEHLEEGRMKRAARILHLQVQAASDPTAVLAALGEVAPSKGSTIATTLGQTLAAKLCPGAAAGLLEREGPTAGIDGMLAHFLASWGTREPEAMLSWVLAQKPGSFRPEVLRESLGRLAAADPEGFLGQVSSPLSDHPELREVAKRAWWGWVNTDGGETRAIAWLRDHPESAPQFDSLELGGLIENPAPWSPERTARLLAALESLPPDLGNLAFSHELLRHLSEFQPRQVIDFAARYLPLGNHSDLTFAQVVGNWAETEPEAAVRWSLGHFEAGEARETAIRFAVSRLGEKDPAAAAALSLTLPEKERDEAFWGLAFSWAEKDPEGLLSYLRDAPDPHSVSSLARTSFRYLSEHHPGESHLRTALEMPAGSLRNEAVRGLFGGWALSEPGAGAAALAEVPEGPLRDSAILSFNGYLGARDPGLSFELVNRLSDTAARERQLVSHGRVWLRQNRPVAEAAIRAHPNLPESVKATLLR